MSDDDFEFTDEEEDLIDDFGQHILEYAYAELAEGLKHDSRVAVDDMLLGAWSYITQALLQTYHHDPEHLANMVKLTVEQLRRMSN